MSITFASTHAHQPFLAAKATTAGKPSRRGKVATFFSDLFEDLREKPLQPAHLAKHDMFREHINAMSICYFGLILLLIVASLPVLAYLIAY